MQIMKNKIRREAEKLISATSEMSKAIDNLAIMFANESLKVKALQKQKSEMLTDIQMLLFAEEPHKINEKLFLLWDKYRRDA